MKGREWLVLGLTTVLVLGGGDASAREGLPGAGLLANQGRAPSREERWRRDLAFLKTQLPRLHVAAFHAISREKWEDMVDALAARAGTLTDGQMTVGVMELVTAVGDGHTRVNAGLPAYPLGLRWFEPELRVVAARGNARSALGLRVLEVGGLPLEEAVRRALAVVSHDSEWDGRAGAGDMLLHPDVQQFLGWKAGQFTFDRPSGERLTLSLQAQTPSQAQSDWQVVEAPVTLAESGEDPQYWYKRLNDRTMYLRYLIPTCSDSRTSGQDTGCSSIAASRSFLLLAPLGFVFDSPQFGMSCEDARRFANIARLLLAELDSLQTGDRRVVVDLRGNGGGDSSVIQPLLDGLQARGFGAGGEGKIAVLTDRFTYSSALMNAVQLKALGARLYGEPPGENLTTYGEIKSLTLPNSGLRVWYSTNLFRNAFELGAPQLGDGLLHPDVPVTLTYADYLKGIDPVLEAALK